MSMGLNVSSLAVPSQCLNSVAPVAHRVKPHLIDEYKKAAYGLVLRLSLALVLIYPKRAFLHWYQG